MAKVTATVEQWLTPKQASALLGITAQQLRAMRNQRRGPRFKKLGDKDQSRCVYLASDIAAWQAKQPYVETEDSYEAQKAS
jgi:predicted DNA-binding transcriptional regulator AlpA